MFQLLFPIRLYFLWVQTQHGIAEVGIMLARVEHRLTRSHVDGRQEDARATSLTGSLHDGIAIVVKLFAIQMAMRIDEFQIRN